MELSLKKLVKKMISISKQREIVPIEHRVDAEDEFKNHVALISGGSGGIGLAIAKSLLESGCKVIIAGTNEEKLKRCKNSICSNNLSTLVMNYTDPNTFNKVVESAVSIFGKIDIFISSVGVHTENVDFWNMSPKEFDRIYEINLKGTFFACQAIGSYMKNNGIKGHCLIVSSTRGFEPAWSPYGISKWGLNGLTKGLAQLFQPYGIIVNAIAPGCTATELIGIKESNNIYSTENKNGRLVMPDEVASLVKLLVSDVGNMIVGETIRISGGRGNIDIR